MALSFSTNLKNAILDQIETTVNINSTVQSKLIIYSGTVPTNVGTALSGNTVLVEIDLPINWLNNATSGQKTLAASVSDTSANATGTATFFRITDVAQSVFHMQGTVGTSGSDLNLSSTSIVAGGTVTVTGFTLTAGN